jgi:hypothetical protein
MTEGSAAKDDPHPFADEARALGIDVDDPGVRVWMEAHLPEFRQQASGQRPLYWIPGSASWWAWPLRSSGSCSKPR